MNKSAATAAATPDALPLFHGKLLPARAGPKPLSRKRLLAELDRLSSAALTLVDGSEIWG